MKKSGAKIRKDILFFILVAMRQKGIFGKLFIKPAGRKEQDAKNLETEGTS